MRAHVGHCEVRVLDNGHRGVGRSLRGFVVERNGAQRLLLGIDGQTVQLTHDQVFAIPRREARERPAWVSCRHRR